MNSNSMVYLANNVCLKDFQDIAAPPSVKIYPLVDFELFESNIQFASLYPSKTTGSLPSEVHNFWYIVYNLMPLLWISSVYN